VTANQQVQSLIAELDRLLRVAPEQDAVTVSPEFLRRLRAGLTPPAETGDDTAQTIAEAVIAQLNGQSATWLHPAQQELTSLRQQRDALSREIQHLEGQRQQLIADFLQVLLNRLSEALKQEVSQTLASIESQFLYAIAPDETASNAALELTHLPGNPSQRLEQLKYLQQESDRLFITLDSTFHTVFDTLQKDLHSYQDSLSSAIANLHDLGRQNAAPEAPSEASEMPLAVPLDLKEAEAETVQRFPTVTPVQLPENEVLYPFPGMELPLENQQIARASALEAEPEPELLDLDEMDESEIDALLQLDAVEESSEPTPAIREPDRPWQEALFGEDAVALPATARESETTTAASELPTPQLAEANTAEAQLFGETETELETEAIAADLPPNQEVQVENELFADETPIAPSQTPTRAATATSEALSPSAPAMGDTIASLTELLQQAYVSEEEEAEIMPFTPVPAGENLWAVDDAEVDRLPVAQGNLAPEQLEQLNEDLHRFQDSEQNSTAAPDSEGEEIPAELMGENLEQVSIESLAQEEDMWADSAEETESPVASDEVVMPAEINPEPWSGSAQSPQGEPESEPRPDSQR
jgi:cell division protein FtsB